MRPPRRKSGFGPSPHCDVYLLLMRQHSYHAGADMGTATDDAGQLPAHDAFGGEFARRPVSMIVAGCPLAALAARVATTSVPIAFVVGLDPVASGLVEVLTSLVVNATGRRSICLRSTSAQTMMPFSVRLRLG